MENRWDRVRELCQKLRPVYGRKIDNLWRAYAISDEDDRKEIENTLEQLFALKFQQRLDKENMELVPPAKEVAEGEYFIGAVAYNNKALYPFGLRDFEMIQHCGVTGRSGAGKTNLGYIMIYELTRHNKPFIIFDWKRNYRDLLALPEFKKLLVFTIGRNIATLRFNPLIPPKDINPKTWAKLLIEVILHSHFLGDGCAYLLQKAIDKVYREAGVYNGYVKKYPTFRDVLEVLKKYNNTKGREANWLSSSLRAVASLCFGEMDRIINTNENQGLEELLDKQVILELDALTQSDKIFFIETLILWIHHYRLQHSPREEFSHALIIEEAHHILSCPKYNYLVGGESIMDVVFKEIREFGEAIIFIDQNPSQISLPALGNTYCTITMNLKHQRDVSVMANCMLLEGDEKDYLGTLPVGYAIVKLQDRIQKPFLIKIPEFKIKKGSVTDEFVAHKMKDFKFSETETALPSLDLSTTTSELKPTTTQKLDKISIAPEERLFLLDIVQFPNSGTVERYKRLGLSARQGDKIKSELLAKDLIEQSDVVRNNIRLKILNLTEKAKTHLEGQSTVK